MKKLFSLIFALSCLAGAQAQVSFGNAAKINYDWKFMPGDTAAAASAKFDDKGWQSVDLPHDWSVKGRLDPDNASCAGYLPGGTGWYRKALDIPSGDKGKKIFIYFEGVYNRSEVYLNGHLLGKRPNGFISFMYDATPYVRFGGENVVAVRVDHSRSADCRWYTGSGIYRNVWLVKADPLHIAQWGVYAWPSEVSTRRATLNVETEVSNEGNAERKVTVENTLYSADGRKVAYAKKNIRTGAAATAKATMTLKVKNPQLWSTDTPVLYNLKTVVSADGRVTDSTVTRTGFRSFVFDPDKGFFLNGKNMKMKGVCLHHDAGVLGAAVPRSVWRDRLDSLKALGCNAVRTSHNPQSPDLYNLCDELGMLVLDEAFDEWEYPKRKWLDGWNVGTPGFESSCDFFNEWGERDVADLVRRDRNHVSVFAWSIGNEVDYPNDPYSHPVLDGMGEGDFAQPVYGGYKKDAPKAERLGDIAKRLAAAVKKYDLSRPVTAGLAGVVMSNATEYPGALDIAGYNYTENRYDTDHKLYPNRVIYGSENKHFIDAWYAVKNNEHIFGQFLWTGIDYLGEAHAWPSRGFYAGLLDLSGTTKPLGYFRKALWSEKPTVYIGTYPSPRKTTGTDDEWTRLRAAANGSDREEAAPSSEAWAVWNYEEGETVRVVCYTNQASARLELDGKTVGEEKPYDAKTGIIYWDIPYRPGRLTAVALDDKGTETARYAIETSGAPAALRIVSTQKQAKAGDVVKVVLEITDNKGIPAVLADNEITCNISGAAKLLGLEAANNTDMGDYTDNRQRAYRGRLTAYLKTAPQGGKAYVRFSSPMLKAAELEITVK